MKIKVIALFLSLTLTSWAQSTTPTPEQKSAPGATKATCACCDRMASADQESTTQKEIHACMRHSSTAKDDKAIMSCCTGKDNAGCCAGKDGKSCAKSGQASASCCMGNKDKSQEMTCCSDKDGKTMTHDCCGGNQCGKHDYAAGN